MSRFGGSATRSLAPSNGTNVAQLCVGDERQQSCSSPSGRSRRSADTAASYFPQIATCRPWSIGGVRAFGQKVEPRVETRRQALGHEIARAERALERYYAAFETGSLEPARFHDRVFALDARLAALNEQEAELRRTFATRAHTAPDAAALAAVADQLERTIAETDPKQAKALLRLLIKELKGERQVGDPSDLPRRHARGLRTAKVSGRTWDRTSRAHSPHLLTLAH